MSAWHLEWLRLWRTRQAIALAATFVVLGLGLPVLTYYLPELISGAEASLHLVIPKQTATDSLTGFTNNAAQLGTLIVVVVGAATLAIDSRPVLAVFYRTRVHRPSRLVLPRFASVVAISVVSLALGTFGAWYETTILFSQVSIADLTWGLGLEAVWFLFVTSVVTLMTSAIRSVLGVVGASVALLLGLSLLDNLEAVATWLPTHLAASGSDFVKGTAANDWHAVIVAAAATLIALGVALNRIGRREIGSADS
jgi:ABC-2 type transport system permease protein